MSDSIQIPRVPFKILALGRFSPSYPGVWQEPPIHVDRLEPDQAMRGLDLTCHISVSKQVCPAGTVTIRPTSLKEFHPDHLSRASRFFAELVEAKRVVEEAVRTGMAPDHFRQRLSDFSMLPPLAPETVIRSKTSAAKAPNGLDDLLNMVALPDRDQPAPSDGIATGQFASLARLALEQVYADPDFRATEAVWRGVRYLTAQLSEKSDVALALVPAEPETLEETLNAVGPHLEAAPPSLLVIDLPLDNSAVSMDLLATVGGLSERLLAPAICWISHRFLHVEGWDGLEKLAYLPHHIAGQPYAKWRRFTQSAAARWLAITCNPLLARPPFGPGNMPRIVPFQEANLLWMSPVWCFAGLIAQSMVKTSWPTRFTSWKEFRAEDLPVAVSEKKKARSAMVDISEDRFGQFLSAGITPVLVPKSKDYAIVPDETTAAGTSFAYQCLLARTVQILMALEVDVGASSLQDDIALVLKHRFSLFWEKTGFPPPEDLLISNRGTAPNGGTVVAISFTPPPEILPSRQKLELEFVWGGGTE